MKEPKVAKILDNYNLVINKGKNDNIKIGQEYLVYEQTEEICDPETGLPLECLFVPKGKGIITRVQNKISILHSHEWEKPSSLAEALTVFAQPQKLKAFYKPNVGDSVKYIDNDYNNDSDIDEDYCSRCGNELSEEEKEDNPANGLCEYCNSKLEDIKREKD